jgi:hypothetical protein
MHAYNLKVDTLDCAADRTRLWVIANNEIPYRRDGRPGSAVSFLVDLEQLFLYNGGLKERN